MEPNSYLIFNGKNQYARINLGDKLPIGNKSRTLECWVRVDSIPKHDYIVSWGNMDKDGAAFGVGINVASPANFRFWGHNRDSDPIDHSPTNNKWHFLAAAYDSSKVTLYVDGIKYITFTADLNTGAGDLFLGTRKNTDFFLQGAICNVAIWDHARTDAQIKMDFEGVSLTGNEAGLAAYIPLNEGIDTQISERRSGTLGSTYNSPTWFKLIPLENAKLKWKTASNYDVLQENESTLLGVEASGNVFVYNPNSGVSTLNAVGGVIVTKTPTGPEFKVMTRASFMDVVNPSSTNGIDTINVNIFEAHAEAKVQYLGVLPLYAGAGVGFKLAGGEASIFDFNLGVGLSTGIGLKERDTVEFKVAGTGVQVGKKISISVLDNSFGIDLERTTNAVWFVGKELAAAVAIVPGALADSGVALKKEITSMPATFKKAGGDLWGEAKKIPGAFAEIPSAFAGAGKDLWLIITGKK